MTEDQLRITLLADRDQPWERTRRGPETPREAAFGAFTDFLCWLAVVGFLLWDGLCHGDDGQPAGSPNSFSAAMAPVVDLWLWTLPALALVLFILLVTRTKRS